MQPVFKRLDVLDVPLLSTVAEDVFDHEITVERATRFLADARNILVVAMAGNFVIGQIMAIVHHHIDAPTDLFIENLGVAAGWRRAGIARRLLALALHEGAAQGAEAAWVATEEDNAAARGLYSATGATGGRFVMYSYATLKRKDDGEGAS